MNSCLPYHAIMYSYQMRGIIASKLLCFLLAYVTKLVLLYIIF